MLTTDQEITHSSRNNYLDPYFSHFHPLDGKPALYPFFNEVSSVASSARHMLRELSLSKIIEVAHEISSRINWFKDEKDYLHYLGYTLQTTNSNEEAWFDSEGNSVEEYEIYDLANIFKDVEILSLVKYIDDYFDQSHLFAVLALMKLSCMQKWIERCRHDKDYCWLGIAEKLFEAQEAISEAKNCSFVERVIHRYGTEDIEKIIQVRKKEEFRKRALEGAQKRKENYQPLKEECQKYYKTKKWSSPRWAAMRISEDIKNNPGKWSRQFLKRIPTFKTIEKWLKEEGESA